MLVAPHDVERLGDRLLGLHGHRIDDHAALRLLDLVDLRAPARSIGRLRWMTPMPPSCAMRDRHRATSVTVSIAALSSGMLRLTRRDRRVPTSARRAAGSSTSPAPAAASSNQGGLPACHAVNIRPPSGSPAADGACAPAPSLPAGPESRRAPPRRGAASRGGGTDRPANHDVDYQKPREPFRRGSHLDRSATASCELARHPEFGAVHGA